MKKSLFILVALVLALAVFTGCDDSGVTSGVPDAQGSAGSSSEVLTDSSKDESKSGDIQSVCFAMTPEELIAELERLEFELDIPDYNAFKDSYPDNAVQDGRKYDWKYKYDSNTGEQTDEKIYTGFYYDAVGPDNISIQICYDINGDFKSYSLGNCPSPEGVNVGDDFGKMLDTYGDDYTIIMSKPELSDDSYPSISFRYDYAGEYIIFSFHTDYDGAADDGWYIDMGDGKILNVYDIWLWSVVGEPHFADHNYDVIDKEVEYRS